MNIHPNLSDTMLGAMELISLPQAPAPLERVYQKNPETSTEADHSGSHPPSASKYSVPEVTNDISKKKTAMIIGCITFSTGITTFLTGVVTIAIPFMAVDLSIPNSLTLWPATIYSLTCGCTLLLCGSLSDVIGGRNMFLSGCFLQSMFTLACGLSQTSTQIILFRALSGVAASFCLPSAVSLINNTFYPGKSRNIAFASMGGAQPVCFGVGLVLGGVFTGGIGWRWGFHISAIINFVMLVIATWQLPRNASNISQPVWNRLISEIDWMGVTLVSGFLAMLSYVIAEITGSISEIRSAKNISLLILAFALLTAFVLWVGRQERLGRPALIPNSLWRHRGFSCICINVFFIWAAFNATEQYLNFYFQDVQQISPLGTALRFLPAPVSGALSNVLVGLLVHRVRGDHIVIVSSLFSAVASLVMATIHPSWSYWRCAFVANLLNPAGADGLFTVSNLLITSMFPQEMQGVAGGVFNTVSQTGKSVGMALTALVADQVTARSHFQDKASPEALLVGYRAAFWFCVALVATSLCTSIWGLRSIGKVGLKRD